MRALYTAFLCLVLYGAGVREVATAQNTVLFLGSSSIYRWSTLERDFPGVKAINQGIGGSRLSDISLDIEGVVSLSPRTIVLYAGENDLHRGASAEEVCRSYMDIVERLKGVRIVYITIKPSPQRFAALREKIIEANACIKRAAAGDLRLFIADVYPLMIDQNGQPKTELFGEDTLHMNGRGYEIWRSVVAPLIYY